MKNNIDIPILYILMRTDLASMNAGKAVSQGAHAANQFVKYVDKEDSIYINWIKSTNEGFGTTIVLGVNEHEMIETMKDVSVSFESGIVFDPSYPITDGEFTHHIELDTCAYVFGLRSELEKTLSGLSLMK